MRGRGAGGRLRRIGWGWGEGGGGRVEGTPINIDIIMSARVEHVGVVGGERTEHTAFLLVVSLHDILRFQGFIPRGRGWGRGRAGGVLGGVGVRGPGGGRCQTLNMPSPTL